MSYECDHCGASFDTLSRFRLYECSSESTDDTPIDSSSPADPAPDSVAVETEYPALVSDLSDIIEEAKEGDLSALYRAVAEYETALTKNRHRLNRALTILITTYCLRTTSHLPRGWIRQRKRMAGICSLSS